MHLKRLLTVAALAGLPLSAHATVYSNVRVDDTNGETHGMRVELRDRTAIVTDCERQCGAPVEVPLKVDGKRITFSVDLGRGAGGRFTGELRENGTLVLRGEGRLWNAQILRPEDEAASVGAPAPGQPVVVPSLAGMDFASEKRDARLIRVAQDSAAGGGRFAGFYSNIVYREGAEATEGMAIDFRPGQAPVVTVHDCERYCAHIETVPVRVRGNRIAFTLEEEMGGLPGRGRRYAGEFRADGTLKVWGEGHRAAAQVLRPQARE